MIALHACDTATDHAIHVGLRAGAQIIMCSPCCHKELRPQMLSAAPLRPMLQHGMHLGQQAEMLTDGLRALLLEACGYDDPGVRVRRAGAHQQEQDDPGGHAAKRGRTGGRSAAQIERSRASTACASSAWRCCSRPMPRRRRLRPAWRSALEVPEPRKTQGPLQMDRAQVDGPSGHHRDGSPSREGVWRRGSPCTLDAGARTYRAR